MRGWVGVLLGLALAGGAGGQAPDQATPEKTAPDQTVPAPAVPAAGVQVPSSAGGKVLFSTDHPPVPVAEDPAEQTSPVSSSSDPKPVIGPGDVLPKTPVTNAERAAVVVTSYDLDLHLVPGEARLEAHVSLTVRNVSSGPAMRIPLQISSTLRWQTVSAMGAGGLTAVGFTQSPVATDTDHTGYAQEAVITPAAPLAAGGTLTLSAFYVGEIRQSGARLEVLGTAPDRAGLADWDEIVATGDDSGTALRGFGNVIWYPVAAPTAVLGDGNKLLEAVGRERLAEARATVRLRLAVEYVGDPPVGVIFDGELKPLVAAPDEQDQAVSETHGLATVEFGKQRVGFRTLSLFLTAEQPETTAGQTLSVISGHEGGAGAYRDAVASVRPLVTDWFGVNPIRPVTLLDHAGDPFEDGALLVTQVDPEAKVEELPGVLVRPMTHAWFRSGHPWISDGLAEFMGLLWTERSKGREAALAELGEQATLIGLAEPDLSAGASAGGGQALVEASSPVYFRTKAAAVWWQLREILGEDVLRQGLVAYRHSEGLSAGFDDDPKAVERTLEKVSGKDLGWFFADWVYRDKSLPDLTIVEVNPRELPDKLGKSAGYLVAVEVRNEGDAAADVPVTVKAGAGNGALTGTERLRIPGHSVVSTRILFNGTPESVQVNDGSVPELRESVHVKGIQIRRE